MNLDDHFLGLQQPGGPPPGCAMILFDIYSGPDSFLFVSGRLCGRRRTSLASATVYPRVLFQHLASFSDTPVNQSN